MRDDPRLGKVSASRFEILALCHGSEQLRRTLPPEALESGDEYTEAGDRIHAARQTGNTFPLQEGEPEIYNTGMETEKRILAQWIQDFEIEEYEEGERELRLYLNDPNTMKIVASGQLDVHYISKTSSHVLIVDWKALWSPNLTPAERNHQGRLQAVLAAKEYDAKHVRMAFDKAMFGRQDVTDYNDVALEFAETSIHRAIWESEQPGAQRRPGSHCTYCPCKAYCNDAARYSMVPISESTATTLTKKEDIETVVSLMPVESAVTVWQKRGVISKILEAIEARLKSIPEEHERLGLAMKEGRRLDTIKDKVGAFNALREGGLSSEQIIGCMKFSKEDLLELLKNERNMREAEAKAYFENGLDPFIERGRAKPSLVEK